MRRDVLLPKKKLTRRQLLEKIIANVVGYDLNPLAVISARTNYLLALGDLLDEITGEIDIPIYLADSVMTPSAGETLDKQGKILFQNFRRRICPAQLSGQGGPTLTRFANLLEEHVKNDAPTKTFTAALCEKFPLDPKRDKADIRDRRGTVRPTARTRTSEG